MKVMPTKNCEYCGIQFTKNRSWSYKVWGNKRGCNQSHSMKIAWSEGVFTEERNKKVAMSKMGSKNPAWVGDDVTYKPLHKWISKHKVKQKNCSHCKKEKWLELANVSKKYRRDINDFVWLCRLCHRKYDSKATPELNYL